MSPRDDELDIFCPRCEGGTTLRFEDSFQNRTLRCTSCGGPIYWRSCPVCETGWEAQHPGEPCGECGADMEGQLPPLPARPPRPRGRRSPWHRACPVCGVRSVPFLALVGSRYVCPHCKRTLTDAAPFLLWLARLFLGFLLSLVLAYGLAELLRAALGVNDTAARPLWRGLLFGVVLLGGSLAFWTQTLRLRPWRP